MAILGRCLRLRGLLTCSSHVQPAGFGCSRHTLRPTSTELSLTLALVLVMRVLRPLLHSTHVMRSTGKAWACLGCKQFVGVTSKTLKTALQLPCRSVGRQSSLSFRAPHVSSPPLPIQACGPPPAPPEMAQASRSSQPRLAFAAQHGRVSDAPVSAQVAQVKPKLKTRSATPNSKLPDLTQRTLRF